MSEYGRGYIVTETEAAKIKAANEKLTRDGKAARAELLDRISIHRQAEKLGMSDDEYIKKMGIH